MALAHAVGALAACPWRLMARRWSVTVARVASDGRPVAPHVNSGAEAPRGLLDPRLTSRIATSGLALLLAVAASGCMMIGPDYQRPAAPVADGWIARDAPGIAPEAEPIGPWWESFGDPILSDLIAEAYRQNPSLQAAGVRVLEAQARRGIAIGTLFPQTQNAVGGYRRIVASENVAVGAARPQLRPVPRSASTSPGSSTSGARSGAASSRRTPSCSPRVADYDDVLVSLLAEVAANYIGIRTAQEELDVAQAERRAPAEELRHRDASAPSEGAVDRRRPRAGGDAAARHRGADSRSSRRRSTRRRARSPPCSASRRGGWRSSSATAPGPIPEPAGRGRDRHPGRPPAAPARRAARASGCSPRRARRSASPRPTSCPTCRWSARSTSTRRTRPSSSRAGASRPSAARPSAGRSSTTGASPTTCACRTPATRRSSTTTRRPCSRAQADVESAIAAHRGALLRTAALARERRGGAEGRRSRGTSVRRGRRRLHDGAARPAVPRPAAGPARREPGPGGAHAGDALQEPRRRLGAVGRARASISEETAEQMSLADALGRPARGARATERRARRQQRHRAGSRLVALAMVEATVVANRRTATRRSCSGRACSRRGRRRRMRARDEGGRTARRPRSRSASRSRSPSRRRSSSPAGRAPSRASRCGRA